MTVKALSGVTHALCSRNQLPYGMARMFMSEVWNDLLKHTGDEDYIRNKIDSMLPKKYRRDVCRINNFPTELANYLFKYEKGNIRMKQNVNKNKKKNDVYKNILWRRDGRICLTIAGERFPMLGRTLMLNLKGKYVGKRIR